MNTDKKAMKALLFSISGALLVSCSAKTESIPGSSSAADANNSVNMQISNIVTQSEYPTEPQTGSSVSQDYDTQITLGDDIAINGSGAYADGGTLTISDSGTYLLSGTVSDGQIVVDTQSEEKVVLLLNGVSVSNSNGCSVNIVSAPKKVVFYSCEDSVNIFTDSADYYEPSSDSESDLPSASIYSKEDLEFDGNGSIYVTGNCCKGIFSKDDLEILSGEIYVTAVDDGIRGKDSVTVSGGTVNITSGADGLRTSNETDEGKGNISINNAQINICAAFDGIQSVSELSIENSAINVLNGGGSENAAERNDDFGFGGGFGEGGGRFGGGQMPSNGDFRQDGQQRPQKRMDEDFDGEMPNADDFGGQAPPDINFGSQAVPEPTAYVRAYDEESSESDEAASTKGIKAASSLTITESDIAVDSADDAVHSNSVCTISGGSFSLSSGGDGIHADTQLDILSGNIDISQSYEGIESACINICGGTISINSDDDGMNAADSSAQSGGFGGYGGTSGSCMITISGGYITVNASGDGVDSNGNISMSGGTLIVFGPENSGNSALDYQSSFEMTGGTLLAVGSSGMAQSVSNSAFGVLSFNLQTAANTIMQISDSDGNELICFESPKSFSNVIFTCSELKSGEECTVLVGGSYSVAPDNGIYRGGKLENAEQTQKVTAK